MREFEAQPRLRIERRMARVRYLFLDKYAPVEIRACQRRMPLRPGPVQHPGFDEAATSDQLTSTPELQGSKDAQVPMSCFGAGNVPHVGAASIKELPATPIEHHRVRPGADEAAEIRLVLSRRALGRLKMARRDIQCVPLEPLVWLNQESRRSRPQAHVVHAPSIPATVAESRP